MKLRKQIWGIIGGVAVLAGGTQAGERSVRTAAAPPAASANQAAADDIASAIAREVSDRGYSVKLDYQNGIATLRGTVSHPNQMHRIVEVARSRPSVRRVVNELQVASPGTVRAAAFSTSQEAAQAAPQDGQTLNAASPEFTFPGGATPQYDAPYLPPFAWPAAAPYPNYTSVQYPTKYAGSEWPHIGPFHPYPEPPLDWRQVKLYTLAGLKPFAHDNDTPRQWHCIKLRWDDGHWYLSLKPSWWARRGFLNGLFQGQDPGPVPCASGAPSCGYHVCFRPKIFTHMHMEE